MTIDRREMLTAIAASGLTMQSESGGGSGSAYLDLKVWRLHNSQERQSERVSAYLSAGLAPALARAGSKLIGAFANVIGSDGPFYVSLSQFSSLQSLQATTDALTHDRDYQAALDELSAGPGLPFVRVESSLLRSFDVMPAPAVLNSGQHGRIFELRTYESQSLAGLRRKVAMFNEGESKIFMRLGFRPVFFGETIIGPKQPNLMYMLSYDDLAQHDKLWRDFGSDPEWKSLSGRPELSDAQIVANISNVILRPLPFSPIR